jgi:hypothetical protein
VNRAGRVFCFAVGLLLAALAVTSCAAAEEVPAAAVLSRMLARERDCPAGTVYLAFAEEGSAGELSDGLCAALYGEGTVPAEWAAVEDFALFLTARDHPAELAVFRAASRDGAEEIAELCVRRLTALRRYRRGSEYEAYTEGAQVVILGRYVVMAVSADAEGAVEEARAELRGAGG